MYHRNKEHSPKAYTEESKMEEYLNRKNIACIGAGYWGKNLVRNFASLGALHTICDCDSKTLKKFKETYPKALLTTDVKDVFKNSAIQGVVIATPAETHFAVVKQALYMGKDVLVEKPLALSVREGEELVSLARSKEKILMVGHILAYHPGILKLKELVRKGELGKINYVYSNRLNLGKFRKEENILWSFAPHDISVILMLLGEMPVEVSASGGTYLQSGICDVTITNMRFASGARAHIFVSWLHPFKEQKLIVVGDNKMAVFDDVAPKDKLLLFEHRIDWIDRQPVPRKDDARIIELPDAEPLREECVQFLNSITTRQNPPTDSEEGVRVLSVLEASQKSLKNNGLVISLANAAPSLKYFVHHTGIIDENCLIGGGTKIWHFSHILSGSRLGNNCTIGQNVVIGPDVTIGNGCKIQNNVSLYKGVTLEDNVFCGPSCVFTNVINPRSSISRKEEFKNTLVKDGATIGANATIVCGHTIGRFSFIGAGAVVTENVPDFALLYGNPGKVHGWMCACGIKLFFSSSSREKTQSATCTACGKRYEKKGAKVSQVE
jgi:UDP-2-acetamido-3-amino-2,3-dideoxy-glucuronate N-acetyltransferase